MTRKFAFLGLALSAYSGLLAQEKPAAKENENDKKKPAYELLKPGATAPALNFRDLKGAASPSWDSLRGKVVVLDFWATWCGPCIKAIPELNKMVEHFSGKPVEFFSITYEKEPLVTAFVEKHPMRSHVVMDNGCSMFRSYRAWGIPMIAIAGGDGKIKAVVHPEDLSNEVIEEVLASRTPKVTEAGTWSDPKGAEEYFCNSK